MTARDRETANVPGTDETTIFSHALALTALHGPGPWPSGGHPLPDEHPPPPGEIHMPRVVMDGIRSQHFGALDEGEIAARVANAVRYAVGPERREGDTELRRVVFADRVAADDFPPALNIADALGKELRGTVPAAQVRELALWLVTTSASTNVVKIGIVLLGLTGGEQDRELLLCLGALEELTLFAVVALIRTQPDRQRAVFELAQRVDGWGRIHAVQRLEGVDDPEIKAWLLREGYRNGVMNEYLAHLAATTGGLYEALLDTPDDGEADDALLDGAGGIFAALAVGGPAENMSHYPEAVPALHRYADLLAGASPSLSRLDDLLTIRAFADEGHATDGRPGSMEWPQGEPDRLRARLHALTAEPRWAEVVRAHLAAPVGPYGFSVALHCAGRLGVPAADAARDFLRRDPDAPAAAYVRQWLHNNNLGEGFS